MGRKYQLNLPPVEVEPIIPLAAQRLSTSTRTVEPINLLKITRTALVRAGLSQRWFAAVLGVSEQLASAQLSDHCEQKHLSLRRLGRVDDFCFWREFLLLLAEDLGLHVIVLDAEQRAAHADLQAAAANFTRVIGR